MGQCLSTCRGSVGSRRSSRVDPGAHGGLEVCNSSSGSTSNWTCLVPEKVENGEHIATRRASTKHTKKKWWHFRQGHGNRIGDGFLGDDTASGAMVSTTSTGNERITEPPKEIVTQTMELDSTAQNNQQVHQQATIETVESNMRPSSPTDEEIQKQVMAEMVVRAELAVQEAIAAAKADKVAAKAVPVKRRDLQIIELGPNDTFDGNSRYYDDDDVVHVPPPVISEYFLPQEIATLDQLKRHLLHNGEPVSPLILNLGMLDSKPSKGNAALHVCSSHLARSVLLTYTRFFDFTSRI